MSLAPSRRLVLRALAVAPVLLLARSRSAAAKDYAGPVEVLDTIDVLEADVEARLGALAAATPGARALAASFAADHVRHRLVRADLRRRLRLPGAGAPRAAGDASLEALRSAQEALVYAHAEGLPALGSPMAVDALAKNMIDLARELTVLDLWIEAEGARG